MEYVNKDLGVFWSIHALCLSPQGTYFVNLAATTKRGRWKSGPTFSNTLYTSGSL
jgi:hypothetical protein